MCSYIDPKKPGLSWELLSGVALADASGLVLPLTTWQTPCSSSRPESCLNLRFRGQRLGFAGLLSRLEGLWGWGI